MTLGRLCATLLGLTMMGCASQGVGPAISRKRVTATLELMKRAEAADGAADPHAKDLRKLAWTEYDDAKTFAAAGDNDRASSMLARTEADAALAVLLAEKFVLVQQTAETVARVDELKRKPPGGQAGGAR